jgi:AcrR family transcriptional regulator
MAATRVTRVERKAQTRADLLSAARTVFLRRGFHGASLEEIAQEAGYTKGAVYSNFEDKAALFLAVLDDHYEQRVVAYAGIMLDDDFETGLREVSRFMGSADSNEPGWLPLLSEFIAYAARDDELKAAYLEIRSKFLDAVARILDGTQERHGMRFILPSSEVARASSLLVRGFSAERQLDPARVPPELFEVLHTAMLHGLIDQNGQGGTAT